MSYEEDLKHLRTTLEKLEKLHSDAVVNGDHMDEMLYKENVENVKHQIHIHEQAAKAAEYEAKAKAFDRIVKESKGTFSCGDFCDDVRHIINNYEIGVATDD